MKSITLFDLDHTLLPIDSDYEWGAFTTRLGWTDAKHFAARNEAFYADYKAGTLDIADYVRFATDAIRIRGRYAAELAHAQFMKEVVLPAINAEAMTLVRQFQQAGHEVVIVTATNEFVTRPIAQAFGVAELIAVELVGYGLNAGQAHDSSWISGEIAGIPSAREGKVSRVAQWLGERGLEWGDVDLTFYSDSINDLPLLERVNHPVATNPDPVLRALAHERQWPVLDLFDKR
jgi:HAD superfamily hydrolase (TIGR01490 family)